MNSVALLNSYWLLAVNFPNFFDLICVAIWRPQGASNYFKLNVFLVPSDQGKCLFNVRLSGWQQWDAYNHDFAFKPPHFCGSCPVALHKVPRISGFC
jgi:hypothetical protein